MSARSSASQLNKLQQENARLKAENQRLKKTKPRSKRKAGRSWLSMLRKTGVVLLVSLAVALLTTGNILFWFGNTVVKQDRFVAATAPIIKDPTVQKTMSLYTTNKIFDNTDVQGTIEQALPPRADFLAPQLAKQLRTGVQTTLDKVLANPKFQEKWNKVQARQHDRLISFASKYQGDADISVNEVFNQLTASLKNTKLAFLAGKQLPAKVGDVTVVSASWLPAFHNVVVHIDMWRLLTVIALLISLIAAAWLSRNRRRTIYIFSLASAVLMLATLLAVHVAQGTVANSADPQYVDGVRRIFQIVFHPFIIQTFTILLTALAIWLIAWISGPSRQAAAVKAQVGLLFSGKLHTKAFAEENRFTSWVRQNKRLLQWGVVAILAAIMLLTRLTIAGLFIYLFIMLVLVLSIEVISGESAPGTD
jgi:hypothetical protein